MVNTAGIPLNTRSTAVRDLTAFAWDGVITQNEPDGFSEDLPDAVKLINDR